MPKYEAMALVRPEISDSDVAKFAERYKGVIEEQGGTVEKAERWDKRKLAYEIEGHKEASYVIFLFEAPSKVPAEFGRLLRINDDVIRHRIFVLD